MSTDTTRCADCLKPFRGQSQPRWAFDRAGRFVGAVHISHAIKTGESYRFLTTLGCATPSWTAAQLYAWLWLFWPWAWPEFRSDAWYARLLAVEPCTELSADQERRLARWTTEGPLKLGPERGERIRAEHARLVEGFLAWRDVLDEGSAHTPNPPAAGALRCAW